ncbi:MAG: choice-of-anchor D domain-containing protein, partial [Bacteroidota bacterium]
MKDHLRRLLLVLSLLVFLPIVAGAQWRKVNAYTGTFFNEVFFSDINHGWFTSLTTTIIRTADGGATWQTSILPNGTVSFNRDLCFLSNSVGFISGEDGIWKTSDGGVTWTNITPPSFNKTGSSCSWFIDANTGVFGQGDCNSSIVRFYRTSNGGTTWDSVQYTHTPDVAVGGITYMSGTFYASGGSGKFWTSTDNGATWTLSSTGSAGWQEDLVSSAGSLYIASADGSSCGATGSGKVLRSTNGGANWITTSLPGIVMWGVTMYSATEGWCCGDNGHAYKTTDAGATWTPLACGIDPLARLDDIFFVDATHGWAVGDGIYKYVGDGYSTRPDTIDFGDVIVGTKSADSSAIVQALGGGVSISSRSLGGVDPTQFEPTGSLGFLSVLACQNAPTLVHFAPTSEGVKTSTLTFNITGPNGPESAVIVLKGRGVKPKILAQQSALFDTILCGNVGLDTFYVHNTGNYPLKISSALSPGVNGTAFTVLVPSLLSPVSIAPGDSMRFIVAAITTGPGGFTSALTINSNDPDKPVTNLGLFIYRRTVAAAFDKDTLIVIPSAPLNTASSSICITYKNLGDGKQTIDNVTLVSGVSDQIANTPTISKINVGAGGTQTICFSAMASDTLVHTARYRIRTLPCNLDTFVTVRYQARNPVISTATVKNLSTIVCDSAITDTIQITNTGNAPLVLTKPNFAGADAGSFTILAPSVWPDTIPIGGVRPILISLTPSATPGAHSTTITFPNNDGFPGKSKWSIPITFDRGTVELTPEKRLIDLGDICLNAPTSSRIALRNSGTTVISNIALGPIGNANDVSISSAPAATTIAVKSEDSVTFTARPTKAGAFSSRYIVRYGPCERTDTITIVGNAVGISLAAVPPLVDFGIANVGQKVTRMFTVTNKGTTAATVRSWNFRPAILNANVLSPALPLLLAAGERRDVIVELTPADTGAVRLMLLGA